MSAPDRLFVFGLGYSALTLARRLLAQGWRVAGTTRSAEKAQALAGLGIQPFLFDRGRPLDHATAALSGTTHLLSSVPPDAQGDPVLAHHAGDIAAISGLRWAGYLSTTGVYGDAGGDWVDEDSPRRTTQPRSLARVAAEDGWLALHRDHAVPVHLFRLPGIYGPGRSAIDQVRAGTARRLYKPGQVFSRIHVADIATALAASMARPDPGTAYNVCDDEPAPSHEVTAHAAALLGLPPPVLEPLESAEISAMARSFYAENKRVSNRRLRQVLGVTLAYPGYREGLAAIAGDRGAGTVGP